MPIAGQVYASVSINRSLSMGTHQTTALAILTVPLGERTSASASLQTNRINGTQDTRAEASVQRGLPLGEGVGYYLRGNSDRQNSAGVSYGGPHGRYDAEVYTSESFTSVRGNVTGGIAWVGDKAVSTRPIEQSFALAADMPTVGNLHVYAGEWHESVVFLRKIEPGGSDRSFGIQVARLAGLPAGVVARAQEILGNLERTEFDREGRPRLAHSEQGAPPGARQLSLFSGHDEAVLDELRRTDPDKLTPLQALALLAELRRRLGP